MRMRSIGVGASSRQRARVSCPERMPSKPARRQAAPAPDEHRQELRREAELLRRRIDAAAAADCEGIAAIAATGHRNGRRMQRVRQASRRPARRQGSTSGSRLAGKRMPSWWQKEEAQAPPARTAIFVRIVPCSVTTPQTRPPSVSMTAGGAGLVDGSAELQDRTAATAGAALAGSAVPSVGEKTPPFQVPAGRSAALRRLRRCRAYVS